MIEDKIINTDTLREIIESHQRENKRVVLCYGVFGVLHIGHIRYLKKARQNGDVLVVVLSTDDLRNGEQRIQLESRRAEALAHLDWVDHVAVNRLGNLAELIRFLKPDVYAKGFESVHYDQSTNHRQSEEQFFENLGIDYVTVREDSYYSTEQINRSLSNFSDDVLHYVSNFRKRYSRDDLSRIFDDMNRMRVLVIGDAILDEYQYCETIGKSSKDPTLVLKYEDKDVFAGGVLAIANHVANFARQVELVTVIGDQDDYRDYISQNLVGKVNPSFIHKKDSPTLVKKRFIDGYSTHKLFEVYIMDDSPLNQTQVEAFNDIVREKMKACDLVIVADYGHGTVSRKTIELLTAEASFLAVNTQSNAGNRGFNTISKYPRSDFVSLAEHEIRLETRDVDGRLVPMIKRLSDKIKSRKFVVTLGRKGCMILDQSGQLVQVPSFTKNVVDRVGAGDAFFAVTAMLSALDVDSEIVGFMGNIAGSLAVQIMGNQKSIDKQSVIEYCDDLYSECYYDL